MTTEVKIQRVSLCVVVIGVKYARRFLILSRLKFTMKETEIESQTLFLHYYLKILFCYFEIVCSKLFKSGSFQAQIAEQEVLSTTEQKLQEELHIEQAVQDIVRLIKQDARTALLIVQLLRRYQLERNQVQFCLVVTLFSV